MCNRSLLVHIKKVDIFGFKSFGFKNTTVQFEPGLVSISGPNGSGKSNILDAIIFAMGENKPRIMRVDKLRSLIHDIEGSRHGPKMARSSVHFDNSDRRIPIDSDTVEITREMDSGGDNTYYLNKKKTTRSNILDLLDMANAGLGQLNAVQQGTITRISEMSSDEKRTAIETMLGLSYFDEKKTDALKQLEEADTRLKIALVKMQGMKERLDELEEERNQKMRHDFLQGEIARYNAIDAANKIKEILGAKSSIVKSLEELDGSIKRLDAKRHALQSEIDGMESEKATLMSKTHDYNQNKAALDLSISNAMQNYDSAKNAIAMSRKRTEQIESRLPNIHVSLQEANARRIEISEKISNAKKSLELVTVRRNKVDGELAQVDSHRSTVLNEQSQAAANRSRFNEKIKKLTGEMNDAKLNLSKLQNKKTDRSAKLQSSSDKLEKIRNNTITLKELKERLEGVIKNHSGAISELELRLDRLRSKKSKIESNMEDLGQLLEKTSKAATQYESKIKTVKGFMHEDYTVAKLKEDAGKLGILGLAYEMITWDKRYDRPILAASSDWLKAVVVKDFATLLNIAEFARSKNLSKLKIIPLEAIPRFRLDLPKNIDNLGVLSDYVRCDRHYEHLKAFLFGSIVLADSRESAYRISKAGYKSVTMDGEFFEARGGTVTIDINSKLSKLTKLISMSTDIDGLFSSIKIIKRYMRKQKNALVKITDSTDAHMRRLSVSNTGLAKATETKTNLESRISSAKNMQMQLTSNINGLSSELSGIATFTVKCKSHIDSLEDRIMMVEKNYTSGLDEKIGRELSKINTRKSDLERQHTNIASQHHDASSELASLQSEDTREVSDIKRLDAEEASLSDEKAEQERSIKTHEETVQQKQDMLERLRQKEQDMISSSSSSIGHLEECLDKLKSLSDKEKAVTKESASLQRESDSLQRDMRDLEDKESHLRKIAHVPGIDLNANVFDVAPIIHALSAELQSLNSLNAKAPENYLVVSNGYSSWSPRKNALEEERGSIVKFIEEIDRDKRQTFLDAFDLVDKEIRLIFSKMTGGNAWLELQNEDDIFSSGISYLIQFPSKKKRESTSISGGEKTLAAIVFVLALQKLKPSPFYLFDEIDAHLDAPNSERLAKILGERANESQFIMVSLKDSVVQKAKLIYGVYPKNGVSNVVTYRDKRIPNTS